MYLRVAVVMGSLAVFALLCHAEEDYEASYEELSYVGASASGASFTAEAELDQTDVFAKVYGVMTNLTPGTMISHSAWALDGNSFEGTTTLEAPEWRVWNKRVARAHVWVEYYSTGPGTTYLLQASATVQSQDATAGWAEINAYDDASLTVYNEDRGPYWDNAIFNLAPYQDTPLVKATDHVSFSYYVGCEGALATDRGEVELCSRAQEYGASHDNVGKVQLWDAGANLLEEEWILE